jgi:hypothetical protein
VLAWTVGAILLAAGTSRLEPWVAAGPARLDEAPVGPAWVRRETGGSIHLEGEGVTLSTAGCEGDCRVVVATTLVPPPAPWRLVGEVERRSAGERSRLFVSARGVAERRWYASRAFPAGEPRTVAVVIEDDLAGLEVEIGALAAGSGEELVVRRLTVTPARRSVVWGTALATTLLAFLGAAREAATRAWSALDRAGRWVAGLVAGGVVAGVVLPRAQLDALLLTLPGATEGDLDAHLLTDPTLPVLVQKLGGHGLAFAVLGALAARADVAGSALLARAALFAVATESLQLLVPGRSAQGLDAALDTGAAVLGWVIVRAARRALRGSAASRP